MKPEDIELIRRVFPNCRVETEGDDITGPLVVVVDGFLRFGQKEYEAKSIGKVRLVPGYEVVADGNDDVIEIAHHPNLGAVAIEGAKWLAGYLARCAVDTYNTELFANECNAESKNG